MNQPRTIIARSPIRLGNLPIAVGFVGWLQLAWLPAPPEVWALAFAPTVLIPLALGLLEPLPAGLRWVWPLRAAKLAQLPAALLLVASFFLPQGNVAATLAAAWLITTLLLALHGLDRLWKNGVRISGETAIATALLLLPVGAGWTLLSRAGIRPQDFSDAIVLLTGVHFHYAGFALPLLTGLLISPRPARLQQVIVAVVVVGVPAVGVGISLSPTIEVLAALALAVACFGVAALQVGFALQCRNRNATLLLLLSSAALVGGMCLASIYAVGEFIGSQPLPIPLMIASHGMLNAFGFALCGVLGRRLEL